MLFAGAFIPHYLQNKIWEKTNWLFQETACLACYQLNPENLGCSRKTRCLHVPHGEKWGVGLAQVQDG